MRAPIALAALAMLAGCPPKNMKSTAVCVTARPLTKTGKLRSMRAADWFNLVVDRAPDGAPADCTGGELEWPEPQGCAEGNEPGTPLPATPFAEDDVTVNRVEEGTSLVWVVTNRFSNGDGMGPVVLVTEGEQNMEVEAVGSLRAKAKRPRLKLMHLGKLEILTADGEACERDDDPTTCRRSMTFMVRQGSRFNPMRIVARNGECLGPAVIYVARQQTVPLPSGWKRKLEMNSTMETQEARFVVTEQVVVSDYDPTRPGVPPRPVRRADAEIVYWPGKGAKLIASDASLWSRILDQIAKEPEQ